jgi:hypothetical protein
MSNYSPSREPQSSMSLFRAPNREPSEDIGSLSNRPHSPISILNDDVLLNIFYLYRLHCLYVRDEDEETPLGFIRGWDRQPWWYKPAQVSRHWRDVILASPSLLDLHLVCTFRVHVAEMLAHYPPFPLTIFYKESLHEMTNKDEEGALFALSHRDRVHRISLRMPHHKLEKFTVAMDGEFPTLEHLDIDSSIPKDPRLILPQMFEAPKIRHVDLRRVALPILCPLLTIARGLVFLRLEDIPRSTYLSPSYLLRRFSFMPQLETLRIGFYYSPLRNHDDVDTPTMTHVILPNLRVFSFRGFEAYLEGLLSRMSTPKLSTFHVQYFNQLMFSFPRLLPFMQTSENLGFHAVKLIFSPDSFHLESESDPQLGKWKYILNLQIRCRPFDWQVSSAVQILSTLSPILSIVVEKVALIVNRDQSSGRHDDVLVYHTEWRELFRLFNNVKALRVETNPEIIGRLSHSLRTEDGELPLELLPNLKELRYSQSYVADAFMPFTNERQAGGHPVRLVQNPDCSHSRTRITFRVAIPSFSSSHAFQQVCDNYSLHTGADSSSLLHFLATVLSDAGM